MGPKTIENYGERILDIIAKTTRNEVSPDISSQIIQFLSSTATKNNKVKKVAKEVIPVISREELTIEQQKAADKVLAGYFMYYYPSDEE